MTAGTTEITTPIMVQLNSELEWAPPEDFLNKLIVKEINKDVVNEGLDLVVADSEEGKKLEILKE